MLWVEEKPGPHNLFMPKLEHLIPVPLAVGVRRDPKPRDEILLRDPGWVEVSRKRGDVPYISVVHKGAERNWTPVKKVENLQWL